MEQQPNHLKRQHSQANVTSAQLPDETYIAKLFPKCQPPQPKSAQMRAASQTKAKRQLKSSDRQQQLNKRQTARARQQTHTPQPPQQTFGTNDDRNAGDQQQQQFDGITANKPPETTSSKSNSLHYHNRSTDSSENEKPPTGGEGLGPIKRSESNRYGFDASNSGANDALEQLDGQQNDIAGPQYGRHKTRKYKASKNLQQQLRRSQSSYNRLLNPQPLPVDPGARRPSREDAILAGSQAEVSQAPDGETQGLIRSALDADEGPRARQQRSRQVERSKRTCRGIVFAEPIASTAGEGPAGVGQLNGPAEDVAATVAPAPPKARPEKHQKFSQRLAKTADQEHARVAPDQVGDIKSPPQIHTPASSTKRRLSQPTKEPESPKSPANDALDLVTEVKSDVEGEEDDDDKFINLFVYNTTASQAQRKSEEKNDDTKQQLLISGQAEAKQTDRTEPVGHRVSRQLLDANLGEEGLISNDTSTEELCNLGYNSNDNNQSTDSTPNLKEQPAPTKRILDRNDGPPATQQDKLDSGVASMHQNKSTLKHHRPISTLQTVDEKAECNMDEEDGKDNETAFETLTPPKDELIDISDTTSTENNMSRHVNDSGSSAHRFVPPGFPQRVRPQQASPPTSTIPNQTSDMQLTPSGLAANTAAGASLCPAPNDEAQRRSKETNSESQTRVRVPEIEAQSVTGDSLATAESIDYSEESKSVIERNLSEALNRVSLNQANTAATVRVDLDENSSTTTLRQLKLPNETSHYSAMRLTGTVARGQDAASPAASRSANFHFNNLSDGESGLDEQKSSSRTSIKKRQQAPHSAATFNVTRYSSPGTSVRVDDDLAPVNRTALVFPRLDEGLSSEAESGEDENEDDDDRAMDADVDADDDDDDDDDAYDDDADSPTLHLGGSSTMQPSLDSFMRQQHPLKPQNRTVDSLHQQAANGTQSHELELGHQIKASPNSAYNSNSNSFIGSSDAQLDHNDAKSMSNYPNQNGGQSNYWIGVQPTNHQQAAISSRPASSSSQHFSNQRNQPQAQPQQQQQAGSLNNNNNGTNLSRSNSYTNREEAKSVNRLSSDTDNETDRLLGSQRNEQLQKMAGSELVSNNVSLNDLQAANNFSNKQSSNSKEVLIEGVLFNVKYLGSTNVECDGRNEKEDRIHQAELAVHEVKFRNGETQLPVEVQLFISTEKIMVLDDKHKKIMMDHSLRTISYIADIGDAIVLIVRKKSNLDSDLARPISKTSCHVFESNESHTITKSISQAFQVAYTELLKANGAGSGIGAVEPNNYSSIAKAELDYQDVLNTQEMSMTELEMFARKENQREIIVPKQKGEILGISIVESGWGSVLPTAVIASVKQDLPAYRCKKLSVGDQILSINGVSLVGLSLLECQKILARTKSQTVAKLTVVPCPITVEVKIKRPDTKYQLGFSVQHGVICSLLRGGIAERGGVRVGHRIISINGHTVVGVPHDKIVTLLASSIGEIRMKTCLTSLYRHMLGEEKNVTFV